MHFLLFGASGETGRLVLAEALSRGHSVTALVRNPSAMVTIVEAQNTPNADKAVQIIQGTPASADDVERAFTSSKDPISAVVVTLKGAPTQPEDASAGSQDKTLPFMAKSVANALAAMRRHGTRKIVVMQSQGTGEAFKSMNFAFRILFKNVGSLHAELDDHNEATRVVEGAAEKGDVDYVLARPAMLTNGPSAEIRTYADDGAGVGCLPSISRASVASYLVDGADSDRLNGTAHVISN